MPLVAWAVLLLAASFAAALAGPPALVAVAPAAGVAAAGAALVLGRRHTAALAALAAGGLLVGRATLAHDAGCRDALAAGARWIFIPEDDVQPGSVARGALRHGGCDARAAVRVVQGRAAAGTVVELAGRARAERRRVVVELARLGASSGVSRWVRWRARVGARIDTLFGPDAPLVRALVIADMSRIAAEERDVYARAGLVHMLSVSGLHVGVIALALELLASVARLAVVPARLGTLLVVAGYVVGIGAPPPAVRAAVMLTALLLARLLQRPTSPWAVLALGGGAPLVDPQVVLDLGWQLSVVGAAALIAGAALARRLVAPRHDGWRRALLTALLVSTVATLATAPLVAWTFGRIALVGPITNLLADPVMALLQPLLFVALIVPSPAVAKLCADAAHALVTLFRHIAEVASALPIAAPPVWPTTVAAVAAGISVVALLVACCARRRGLPLMMAAAALAVGCLEPVFRGGGDELHVLDVGQGDALALRTARGRWIVFDAGRAWTGGDDGRATLGPYLSRRGGAIALFVLSHPHADHVGGAASLFALRHPARFLDPGYVGTTPPYRAALAAAARERIPWQRIHPGDSLRVDDVLLELLAPDSAWAAQLADANLASSVVRVTAAGHRLLMTGDAERPEEEWLVARYGSALAAEVLKVAHHGSATSSSAAFLEAVRPRLALVSVGAHNAYGHPDPEVLERLAARAVRTLRTDRLGTVVLHLRPHAIDVETRTARWTVATADSP